MIFIGFVLGRIGHVFFGSLDAPYHWIFGLGLMISGLIFHKRLFGIIFLFLGAGLFISDFGDLLGLRFWGVDVVEEFKFWGID